MKTIVLERPYELRLVEAEAPGRPGPDEALVRVRRVGICGTDLHAYQGKQNFITYPRILGHELAVEVVEAGAEAERYGIGSGDRCAVLPYLSCGRCIACRRGKPNCCARLAVLGVHVDGGMCECLKVPLATLCPSTVLSDEALAQVEMLSIGAHAVWRSEVEAGENVLVIGAGPIGLGVAAFARRAGAAVRLLEISEARLAFARRLGLGEVLDGRQPVMEQLQAWLGEDRPTAVFDATGSAASMMRALDYVAHGGRLIFAGHVREALTFSNPEMHRRELTLLCSRNATRADFTRVMQALAEGGVDVEAWITHRASAESLVRDFSGWLSPESGVIKAMLEF